MSNNFKVLKQFHFYVILNAITCTGTEMFSYIDNAQYLYHGNEKCFSITEKKIFFR